MSNSVLCVFTYVRYYFLLFVSYQSGHYTRDRDYVLCILATFCSLFQDILLSLYIVAETCNSEMYKTVNLPRIRHTRNWLLLLGKLAIYKRTEGVISIRRCRNQRSFTSTDLGRSGNLH